MTTNNAPARLQFNKRQIASLNANNNGNNRAVTISTFADNQVTISTFADNQVTISTFAGNQVTISTFIG